MNKKAISPIIATLMLLLFAIVLGTIVMGWGRDYVKNLSAIEPEPPSHAVPPDITETICTQDPLTILKTRYARGEISTAKYLEMKAILTSENTG